MKLGARIKLPRIKHTRLASAASAGAAQHQLVVIGTSRSNDGAHASLKWRRPRGKRGGGRLICTRSARHGTLVTRRRNRASHAASTRATTNCTLYKAAMSWHGIK